VSVMRGTAWAAGMVGVMISATVAGEQAKLNWHTDVQSAWRESQQLGRPLLVFVTRQSCLYCVQMKERTYGDVNVALAIKRSFVPLVLDGGGGSQLLKDLRVTAFPSTFVISPQAVIIDRIDGYVAAETLTGRLNRLRPAVPVANVAKDP
jgi:thioredoxin-related protein